jgi:TolB protein
VALRGVDDTAPPWLYVIRPNGRSLRRLIPVADGDDDISGGTIGDFRPSWSPDSRSIAVAGDGGKSVLAVDLRGRIRWRLARPRALVSAVSWSPDGRRVAFDDDGKVLVVNRDGTNVRALTAGTPYTFLHGWDPSSRYLAITRTTPQALSLLDAQGKGERKLLDGAFNDIAWGWPRRR